MGVRGMRIRHVLALSIIGVSLAVASAADAPGFPPGKTFTYKTTNATLNAVLDELSKQTGVNVGRQRAENDRTLRLDCNKLAFWDALEKIAREADHRIAFAEGGRNLQLVGGGEVVYRETPLSTDRVFRVSAKRVQAVADLDMDRTYVEVTLALNWEPGISVFLVDQPGRSAVAKDNTDQELRLA